MRKRCSIQQGEKDNGWSEQSPEKSTVSTVPFFLATRYSAKCQRPLSASIRFRFGVLASYIHILYLSKFILFCSYSLPTQLKPPQNSKMVNFSGKWVFDHAENMKAVGDALKVDWSKIPEDKTTTTEITQNGDNFHIKTTTAVRTRDVSRNYMAWSFSKKCHNSRKRVSHVLSCKLQADGKRFCCHLSGTKSWIRC